jgi:hypothetical protein
MIQPCGAKRFDALAASGLALMYPAFDGSNLLLAIMDINVLGGHYQTGSAITWRK